MFCRAVPGLLFFLCSRFFHLSSEGLIIVCCWVGGGVVGWEGEVGGYSSSRAPHRELKRIYRHPTDKQPYNPSLFSSIPTTTPRHTHTLPLYLSRIPITATTASPSSSLSPPSPSLLPSLLHTPRPSHSMQTAHIQRSP